MHRFQQNEGCRSRRQEKVIRTEVMESVQNRVRRFSISVFINFDLKSRHKKVYQIQFKLIEEQKQRFIFLLRRKWRGTIKDLIIKNFKFLKTYINKLAHKYLVLTKWLQSFHGTLNKADLLAYNSIFFEMCIW